LSQSGQLANIFEHDRRAIPGVAISALAAR
jgi:hypothetical protein